MADEKLSLHIDTDWKRQAQEEKKRLVEQEAAKAQDAALKSAPSASSVGIGPAAPGAVAGREGGRGASANPGASFASLVQSVLTQVLFYLGDLSARGGEPAVNLDLAKHHIDTLGILEDKTRGNLADEEKKVLDTALYETRMRYVSVASQYL